MWSQAKWCSAYKEVDLICNIPLACQHANVVPSRQVMFHPPSLSWNNSPSLPKFPFLNHRSKTKEFGLVRIVQVVSIVGDHPVPPRSEKQHVVSWNRMFLLRKVETVLKHAVTYPSGLMGRYHVRSFSEDSRVADRAGGMLIEWSLWWNEEQVRLQEGWDLVFVSIVGKMYAPTFRLLLVWESDELTLFLICSLAQERVNIILLYYCKCLLYRMHKMRHGLE